MMTANIPTVVLKKSVITSGEAIQLDMEIKALIARITVAVFDLGERIQIMLDSEGWRDLGYVSAEAWRGNLGIKRQTFFNYKKCAQIWRERLAGIVELEKGVLLNTPYSKILEIKHIILDKNEDGSWKNNNDTVVEWIHKAYTLSRSDLHEELKENHPVPRPLVLHWHGVVHKLMQLNQGKVLTISQFTVQYDASVQNYWQIFGNRKVKGTLQLDEEE